MLRLAMFDVDGTTVKDGEWAPGALELFRDFTRSGVTVALCSGRAIPALRTLAQSLPEVTYLAASSGSLVLYRTINDWEIIGSRRLAVEIVDEIWAESLALELPIWGYSETDWLVPKYDPILEEEIAILGGEIPAFSAVAGRTDITKLLALPQRGVHENYLARLSQRPELAVVPSYPGRIDIIDSASFESKGGNEIVDHLGIDWSETFAVGDGGNDIGMLSKAAVAFALPGLRVADLNPVSPDQYRFDCSDLLEIRETLVTQFGYFD